MNLFPLRSIIKSFVYALKGIAHLFISEKNMRIHGVMAALVIVFGIYFKITPTEWCIATLCITLVFAAEAFNTAIEYLTDLAQPHFHPMAGRIKDVSAGGVLLAAIGAAVAGSIIFLKYFAGIVGNI